MGVGVCPTVSRRFLEQIAQRAGNFSQTFNSSGGLIAVADHPPLPDGSSQLLQVKLAFEPADRIRSDPDLVAPRLRH
jgi:hypothetical protein